MPRQKLETQFTIELRRRDAVRLTKLAKRGKVTVEDLILYATKSIDEYNEADTLDGVHFMLEQQEEEDIRARSEHGDGDGTGFSMYDPVTKRRYENCATCGRLMDEEDHHSGGECNACH